VIAGWRRNSCASPRGIHRGGADFLLLGHVPGAGRYQPALISSGTRLITYVVPAVWLAGQPWAVLHDFWYLGVTSLMVQGAIQLSVAPAAIASQIEAV